MLCGVEGVRGGGGGWGKKVLSKGGMGGRKSSAVKSITGPSLGVFKVNNWAKSKSITGPRSFSHYINRGFKRLFLLSYHCVCVCFFVPNYLAIF